ncbi:MAG: ABC transporter ATP-binding protein [Victivallaceae bacterium]|nr:ABC transporter ATP-binding protein [Victivallaceae bacterium]
MARVTIEKICKSYGKEPVLNDLSFEIADGEIFFLLGASGCGKSTLLRILAGLLTPDAGHILFDGEPIDALPPEKRQTAMVFQNYALWPHMTVRENIAFALRCAGKKGKEADARVCEVLESVRLENFADRRIPALSGGQQQRVALARALAVRPKLLLLDEPLSNLDARLRETMRGEIRTICRREKLTALYVTHDRQEAFSIGDRIAWMDRGVIGQSGRPEELYYFPESRACAEFFGDANFISGKVSGENWETPFGSFPLGGKSRNAGCAMIRPEMIQFSDEKNGFPCRVKEVTFLGESTQIGVETQIGGVALTLRECGGAPCRAGETVYLSFKEGQLVAVAEKR